MKNKVVAIIICIIVTVVTIILIPKDKQYTYSNDGVMYAITEDGVSKDTFPNKGAYIVDVKCNNATGKWLYDDWKLAIEDISGNVYCDVDFTSITTKTYLNEYITDLATNNPDQGTGKLVHENAVLDNSYYTPLSESAYIVTSNNTTNESGTVDNTLGVWTYNSTSNTWQSKNKTDSTVGTISFTVSAGEYKLCYTMSSELNCDYGIIKIDDAEIYNTKETNTTSFICNDLGDLTADNVISVSYSKDSSNSSGDDEVVFYLTSENNYVEVIDTLDAGIRYEGKNPNNYVWFNNELWRIIGVFGSESHGQSGEQLVKIIRANSIGGLAWHKLNRNDWSVSSLKTLLNGSYYDYETNGYDSTNCYGSTFSTANCDYSDIGINGSYRPMIKNVTWYLRGHTSTAVTVETMYNLERTTGTVYDTTRQTEETGYIGLMYPSDYGYSVLSDNCKRIKNLSSYNGTCASNSWMYGQGYEWTITPYSGDPNYVFYLDVSGYVKYSSDANYGYGVRPVLYLDSSVYVINASSDNIGSKENPYIIGM